MDSERIREIIEAGLTDATVQVDGDGVHFRALIVSPDFEGVPRIRQHRMVNELLRDHIDSEALHAISLVTRTPEQHDASNG